MSLEYIRDYYKVPADLGRRIQYTGNKAPADGVIVGADDARLLARLDGYDDPVLLHPTWNVTYLDDIDEVA
jgi:hypothetical protein